MHKVHLNGKILIQAVFAGGVEVELAQHPLGTVVHDNAVSKHFERAAQVHLLQRPLHLSDAGALQGADALVAGAARHDVDGRLLGAARARHVVFLQSVLGQRAFLAGVAEV